MNGREQERSVEVLLQMDGIMAKGYGVVAKFPMRDTALKIKDKAIYAYLCALSGGGIKAWPSRGKILADLQIGKTALCLSTPNFSEEMKMVPEVPTLMLHAPSPTVPVPMAAAALSPAPAQTTVVSGMPSLAAMAGRTVPTFS